MELFRTVYDVRYLLLSFRNADDKTDQGLNRLLNVWEERGVYNATLIESYRSSIKKHAIGK